MRQGVGLVGADVDELRRTAARGAPAARHIRSTFAADRAPHGDQPGGEIASGKFGLVVIHYEAQKDSSAATVAAGCSTAGEWAALSIATAAPPGVRP
jgi:hypothetical protein